jgi:methylmalonyl-CoA mutase N-terminal domain/subunit
MRDRFGATDPRAQQLRFHTQTAGSTLTAQQPDNNIVRVALQAMAAVLGGTQSLHCNGRDEALGLPTESSAQIALRTQQVIAAETGVVNTVEQGATALLDRITAEGGTLAAIESGMIQRQIQESAYQDQQAVDGGERVVVGVNHSTDDAPAGIDILRIDASIETDQCERMALVRASRDETDMRRTLDGVTRAARDGTNLVPPIVEAVEARATVGEVADTLRAVFGEHREDG